jgi:hypothetical protein
VTVVVYGEFGVFDGVDLVAQFSSDEDAEAHRDEVLELHIPEGFRCSAYDDLQVREVPGEYDLLIRLRDGLREARNQDKAIEQALARLSRAQHERAEVRRAAA